MEDVNLLAAPRRIRRNHKVFSDQQLHVFCLQTLRLTPFLLGLVDREALRTSMLLCLTSKPIEGDI